MTARLPARPSLVYEKRQWAQGNVVVGIDEVGKGAWAGPLVVGAAVLPRDRRVYGVRDSKKLTSSKRETMFDRIAQWCDYWAIGAATNQECDELGMSAAQRLATQRALDGLGVTCDVALVDGKWNFVRGISGAPLEVEMIVKGDNVSLSIAAASILAKVSRDRLMRSLAAEFPAYQFEGNKGYPCPRHQMALQGYGPSSIHRVSWAFMDRLVWSAMHRPLPQQSLF